MTNIAHLRDSDKVLERVWYWLCDCSWRLDADFETLQNLGKEVNNLQIKLEQSQLIIRDAQRGKDKYTLEDYAFHIDGLAELLDCMLDTDGE